MLRPIGVSPALTKKAGEDWWRGHLWPPENAGAWANARRPEFPRRAWSPAYLSITVLGEFVQATDNGLQWHGIDLTSLNVTNAAAIKKELDELLELVEYRPGVLAEAMAQSAAFLDYWRGVLSFNQMSHPFTFDLAWVALRVGEFQAMHYKRIFKRPRPSHLSPSLMPPIDPPGHASFPSGHATEAYLLSLCLKKVMPVAAKKPLNRLAQRVARNREVLGVHYPSDSAAGKELAAQTFALLMTCSTVKELIREARKEWAPRT
jgi:hypothetical protein